MKAKGLHNIMPQSAKNSASNSFHQNSTMIPKSANRSQITIHHNKSPSDPQALDFSKAISEFNRSKPATPSGTHNRISYLSEDTMERFKKQLLDKEEDQQPVIVHGKKKKPPGIHLTQAAAELQYQDLEKEENEKIRRNYEEYKRNFHRFVIDKDKNLLYTKPEPLNLVPPEPELSPTIDKQFIELDNKYKTMNPDKIFKKMLSVNNLTTPKSTTSDKHYLRGRIHIEQLKMKSQALIDNKMHLLKNTLLAEEAKKEIEQIARDSAEIIDKLNSDNSSLKAELENYKAKCEDLENQNQILVRKSQVLQNQIISLKENDESMRKNQQNFEALKSIYAALKEKFPDDDIKAILGKYDRLQNYCVDYVKRIQELEIENKSLNDDKVDIRKEVDKKNRQIKEEENKAQKIADIYKKELENKELERYEEKFYKDEYHKLFRGITDLYLKWSETIQIFDGKNQLNLKPNLNDPLDIIKVLNKMIEISTTEKLQKYIKKIIVSANLLLRKHFPDSVNEQFDPDKIYEKVNNYIEKLEKEVARNAPKISKKSSAIST